MDVIISVAEPQAVMEVTLLQRWLGNDPSLRREARITRPPAVPREGELGAVSDTLMVALGSGGAGATLATALVTWLRTRVNDFTLRIRTPEAEVELHSRSTADPEALVRSVTKVLQAGDGAAS